MATRVLLLDHITPVVSAKEDGIPIHILVAPVIVIGSGFTLTIVSAIQPDGKE
jgi:hypothetical protein